MIEKKTVFILGAGASKPYEFPTARELRIDIINNSFKYFLELGKYWDSEQIEWQKKQFNIFTERLQKAKTVSIDLLLSINNDLADLGKKLITLSLNHFEKQYYQKYLSDPTHYDWYDELYNTFLIAGIHSIDNTEDFKNNKVAFITFNYDRSLEYFLWTALSYHFHSLEDKILYEIYSSIPIIHVYGDLGNFNDVIQKKSGNNDLGGISHPNDLGRISKNIKTIYERTDVEKEKIMGLIENAEQLFFMGFGFADENVKAIGLDKIKWNKRTCYSTAFDITDREQQRIKNRLSSNLKNKVQFVEKSDCLYLVKNHL